MGSENYGNWELAAAPFSSPDEDTEYSASSSAVFDPIDGSYEAQCFLRSLIPRSFIPATSKQTGDAVWPSVALLREAKSRSETFLLSNICADHGFRGKLPVICEQLGKYTLRYPYTYLALEEMAQRQDEAKLEQRGDKAIMDYDQQKKHSSTWSGGLVPPSKLSTSPGFTCHDQNVAFLRSLVSMESGALQFGRQPVKQVSRMSMMPAPDTIRLVWKLQQDIGPGSDGESADDGQSLQPLCSAFSDTTPSSYFSASSGRSVPHVPSYSPPRLSLLSVTSSVAAAVMYDNEFPLSQYSPKSSEIVAQFPDTEGECTEGASDVDDNTGPLRTFFLDDSDDEDDDEGEYMTEDAGHTPLNISPVTSYQETGKELDIHHLYEYVVVDDGEPPLFTTSSIEEAEAALIEHYLGDDLLEPEIEHALLFGTHESSTIADVDAEIRRLDDQGSLTLSYSAPGDEDIEEEVDETEPLIVDEDAANFGLQPCRTASRSSDAVSEVTGLFDAIDDGTTALEPPMKFPGPTIQETFTNGMGHERSRHRHSYSAKDYRRYTVSQPSTLRNSMARTPSPTLSSHSSISRHRSLTITNPDPPSRSTTRTSRSSTTHRPNRLPTIIYEAALPEAIPQSIRHLSAVPGSNSANESGSEELCLTTPKRSVKRPAKPIRWVRRAASKSKKGLRGLKEWYCIGQGDGDGGVERGTFEVCDLDPFGVRPVGKVHAEF